MKTLEIRNQDNQFKVDETGTVIPFSAKNGNTSVFVKPTDKAVFNIKNAKGLVKSVNAKVTQGGFGIGLNTADLTELPPDTYGAELWITDSQGLVNIYPDNDFCYFKINANSTVTTGEVIPTTTLADFKKQLQEYVDEQVKGIQGSKGEQGTQGAQGEQGLPGKDGKDATITIGDVTTLDSGSPATVTNVGTDTDAIFDFGIPKGEKGDRGEQGLPGKDGLPGKNGKDGINGKNGINGKDGKDGTNGKNGINGSQPLLYIAYADDTSGTNLNIAPQSTTKAIGFYKTSVVNLIDGGANEYVNAGDGTFVSSDGDVRSNYVKVKPNTQYTVIFNPMSAGIVTGWSNLAYYDSNKTYIQGEPSITSGSVSLSNGNSTVITTPSNAGYLVVSTHCDPTQNTVQNAIQVVDGNVNVNANNASNYQWSSIVDSANWQSYPAVGCPGWQAWGNFYTRQIGDKTIYASDVCVKPSGDSTRTSPVVQMPPNFPNWLDFPIAIRWGNCGTLVKKDSDNNGYITYNGRIPAGTECHLDFMIVH